MRSGAAAIVVVGLLLSPAEADSGPQPPPDLVIDGAGLGHGVGMTQFGAQGQALEGATSAEIIAHYYSGAEVRPLTDQLPVDHWLLTDPEPLWVNLLKSQTSVAFQAVAGSISICDPGCDQVGKVGESWVYEVVGDGTCRFVVDGVSLEPRECSARVTPGKFGTRVSFPALTNNPNSPRDEMGRGKIHFRTPDGGKTIHVVLEIGLEDYTKGIREIPFSFETAALETQAIASRTLAVYRALNKCKNGAPNCIDGEPTDPNCLCHLTRNPSSAQVYAGWNVQKIKGEWVESPTWNGIVDSTAGLVAVMEDVGYTRNGVIETLFGASSGGATENNEDVWGGDPRAYLRSVPDPWSLDPNTTNSLWSWERDFTEDALVAKLAEGNKGTAQSISEQGLVEAIESLEGVGDITKVDGLDIVERYESGRPSRIDIYTRGGGVTDVVSTTSPALRNALGLPSKFIHDFAYGPIDTVVGNFTDDTAGDLAAFLHFNSAWWVDDGSGSLPWANHAHNGDWGAFVVGDFDQDGLEDVAGYRSDKAKWIVGISNGSSFDQNNWGGHKNPDTTWKSQLAGDFNGDGATDIADFKVKGPKWKVLLSQGDTFASADTWKKQAQGFVWAYQVVGDFDNDGYDDIAQFHTVKGKVVVLYGSERNFQKETFVEVSPTAAWSDMLAADFNGDGRDDIALFDAALGQWWVSLADSSGRGGGNAAVWYTDVESSNPAFVVSGRFDGDQSADLARFDADDGTWEVLTSTGGAFTAATWAVTDELKGTLSAGHSVDIDGDGDSDIAAFDQQERLWWVAVAEGGAFTVSLYGDVLAN